MKPILEFVAIQTLTFVVFSLRENQFAQQQEDNANKKSLPVNNMFQRTKYMQYCTFNLFVYR
jgi:hypothetical protein